MIVENATLGPLGKLRLKLRMLSGEWKTTPDMQDAVLAVLNEPEWEQAADEANSLRVSLAHWKVFGEHAESERSRLQSKVTRLSQNEAVLMNALYKACGDDEEIVRQTIDSQGELQCEPTQAT